MTVDFPQPGGPYIITWCNLSDSTYTGGYKLSTTLSSSISRVSYSIWLSLAVSICLSNKFFLSLRSLSLMIKSQKGFPGSRTGTYKVC
jgi:hypothetical protein